MGRVGEGMAIKKVMLAWADNGAAAALADDDEGEEDIVGERACDGEDTRGAVVGAEDDAGSGIDVGRIGDAVVLDWWMRHGRCGENVRKREVKRDEGDVWGEFELGESGFGEERLDLTRETETGCIGGHHTSTSRDTDTDTDASHEHDQHHLP